MKTATIFGQITGFGAGKLIDINKENFTELSDYLQNFYGTIILDDVNKIDDADIENAYSQKVARVIMNTVMSRKNTRSTQIINIQQRSGIEDATATLQKYYENSPESNPTGPEKGNTRVFRGGSYGYQPSGLRVTLRGYDIPEGRDRYLAFGFRCARSP